MVINTQRIDWLDVITTSEKRRESMQPSLYATDTGGQTCYGIRIDEQWLAGRNAAVMFASATAARKFLHMIGVETPLPAGGTAAIDSGLNASCRNTHQCFHLATSGGLGVCPQKQRSAQWQVVHGMAEDSLSNHEAAAA